MPAIRLRAVLLVFVALSLTYSFGQGYDPSFTYGSYPFQTALQDSESVNLATGNLHFEIPLVKIPGRNGHDFTYSMSYNSQIWWGFIYQPPVGQLVKQWTNNAPWTNNIPWAGAGPHLVSPPNWPNIRCDGDYHARLPDGRTLYFELYTSCDDWTNPNNPLPAPQFDVTSGPNKPPKDSNGDYVPPFPSETAYMNVQSTFYVLLQNGEKISFNTVPVIEDTNGNTITYGINNGAITDSLGRQIIVGPLTGGQQNITYQDSNGVSQVVNLAYSSFPFSPQLHWGGVPDPSPGSATLLSSITYPNGDRYDFQYNNYEELSKIIYPTGGYTRYEYGDFFALTPRGK